MGLTMSTVLAMAVPVLMVWAALRAYQRREKVALAAAQIARPQHNPATTRTTQPQRKPAAKNRYRAVSISAPGSACTAAKTLADKRFLVAENSIPALPLSNCDAASCTCTYAHHKDRREDAVERRGPTGLRTQLHSLNGNAERRTKRGRRASDWE